MIKIIVVDDEQPVLDGIKVLIKRHILQADIIGVARSGREAIELCKKNPPDLVLIDVKMPGMTGLEAIIELKKIDDRIRYILITAYERFDIAHKAFEIGVQDYLLKPVTKDRLLEVIDRNILLIENSKNRVNNIPSEVSLLDECRELLEQNFFSLFKNKIGLDEVKFSNSLNQLARIHQLPKEGGRFVVIEANYLGAKKSLFRESFIYKAKGLIHSDGPDRLYVFISEPEAENEDYILQLCNSILEQVSGQSSFKKIAIGSCETLENLVQAWKSALSNWDLKEMDAGTLKNDGDLVWPWILEKEMVSSLVHGDLDRFQSLINEISTKFLNKKHFETLSLVLLHALGRKMIEEGSEPTNLKNIEFEENWNLYEIQEGFKIWAMDLASWWRATNPNKLSPIVSKTRDYVSKNYQKQISLDELASYVGVTPHYLSRVFSDEMNETFVDFLTKIRMKKARELLSAGASIKSCCIEVGYLDPNYFSRLFKKCNGVTPREYVRIKE